jgi:hypothetical protein
MSLIVEGAIVIVSVVDSQVTQSGAVEPDLTSTLN